MKKTVALILIVVMCAAILVGCTTLQGDDDKGASISMFISSFPASLDPASVQLNADTALILSLIYQPLTAINDDGEVVGAMAERWYHYYDDRDEVHKMYFVLNDTMWSDGIKVSAQDFVYAWKRILSPKQQSPYASLLFPIKNAKQVKAGLVSSDKLGLYAEGDNLLSVTFEEEYDIQLFAEAVSCIALSPLRENVIVKAMKDNPIGDPQKYDRDLDWDKNAAIMVANGPFRVQGYEEGTKLVLERNSNYYRDPEEDYLDESVIPYRLTCILQETTLFDAVTEPVDEYTYQYNKYINGHSYFLGAFNSTTFKALEGKLSTHKMLSSYAYFFNTKSEALADAKVRQALSCSLDRNKIAEIMGTGVIASTGFVPSGVFDKTSGSDFRKNNDIYSVTADVSKAKSLVGNVSGKTLKVKYMIPWTSQLYTDSEKHADEAKKVTTYNPYQLVAEYAKSVWESELGFTVELEGVYADRYPALLSSGNWDVIGIDFAMNAVDAFAYLAPFATYYSGNIVSESLDADPFTPHYTGIESAEYDALIDSILYVSDRTERTALLHQAETMFAELCPATALFQYTRSYVISSKVDNLEKNSWYGYYDFRELALDNYIDINSRETEESLEYAAKIGIE